MDLEKQRLALGIAYINEVRRAINDYCPIDECIDIVNSWLTNMYSRWIDIEQDGKLVGFLIVGFPPNVATGFNWYLQESYVLPQYRNKGLMKQTIKDLFDRYTGKYCFHILDGNQKAFSYWHKVIPELGGKWLEGQCGLREENLIFYGFEV